jgi:hypothetical protein
MKDLPFGSEQLLNWLAAYNQALWPAHILAYALALAALVLAWLAVHRPWAGRAAAAILAAMWLATGLVYHLQGFSRLTPTAYILAGLFILQGLMLLFDGVLRQNLVLAPSRDGFMVTGAVFLLWSLAGHPWLAGYLGHPWPQTGLVGLAPGPTVAFTCGLLLWSRGRMPKRLLAVPVLWSFLGFMLALDMGLREEVGLLLVGLVSASLLLPRDLKPALAPGEEADRP